MTSGRSRAVPVLAWSCAILSVALFVAAMVIVPLAADATRVSSISIAAGLLAYSLVGALVASKQPRNAVGWIFCVIGLAAQTNAVAQPLAQLALDRGALRDLALPLIWLPLNSWIVIFGSIPLLFFVFPNGKPPSRRWRPFVILNVALVFYGLLIVGNPTEPSKQPFPLASRFPDLFGHTDAATLAAITTALGVVLLIAVVTAYLSGTAALIVRLRRSVGVERQQLKWFVYAGVCFAGTLAMLVVLYRFTPVRLLDPDAPFEASLFGGIPIALAMAAVPIAAGIGILRYRLYDIDVLIKRTLVYGATSAAIAATFLFGILALTQVLRPLTQGNELAVAASTLLSFAFFQPIRRRVQDAVDRRFDRSHYDASRTLDAFADELRDEVDLEALRSDLLGAVGRTMGPAHASLWLRGR